MESNQCLIFLAHPRSGSSSLFQILQLHPKLNLLEEPFNENFIHWQQGNPNYRAKVHDVESLDGQLALIFANHNGLKILEYQLPDELLVHLLHTPEHRVLFIRRQNLLQAVVSVLVAEQTQLWKKWEMDRPIEEYYMNLHPLDIDDIHQRIASLDRHLQFCENIIAERPSSMVLKLVYEALYFAPAEERQEQISEIWRWLGISPVASEKLNNYLHPEKAKINSTMTYKWIPNASEIERHCGNDRTGWLYK